MNITYLHQRLDKAIANQYLKEIKSNSEALFDVVISIEKEQNLVFSHRKLQIVFQFCELKDFEDLAPLFKQYIDRPVIKRMLFYPLMYHKETMHFLNGLEKLKFLIAQGIDINATLTTDLLEKLPHYFYIYQPNYMGQSLLLLTESQEIRDLIIHHPQFNPLHPTEEQFFGQKWENVKDKLLPIFYYQNILEKERFDIHDSSMSHYQEEHLEYFYNNAQSSEELHSLTAQNLYDKILNLGKAFYIQQMNQSSKTQALLKIDYDYFLYLKDLDNQGIMIDESKINQSNYYNDYVKKLLLNDNSVSSLSLCDTLKNKEILYKMVKFFIFQSNSYALAHIDDMKEEINGHVAIGTHLIYEAILKNEIKWINKMFEYHLVSFGDKAQQMMNPLSFALLNKTVRSETMLYFIQNNIQIKELLEKGATFQEKITHAVFQRKLSKVGYELYKIGFETDSKFMDIISRYEKEEIGKNILSSTINKKTIKL